MSDQTDSGDAIAQHFLQVVVFRKGPGTKVTPLLVTGSHVAGSIISDLSGKNPKNRKMFGTVVADDIHAAMATIGTVFDDLEQLNGAL